MEKPTKLYWLLVCLALIILYKINLYPPNNPYLDWGNMYTAAYIIKDAVLELKIPWNSSVEFQFTKNFIAIPEFPGMGFWWAFTWNPQTGFWLLLMITALIGISGAILLQKKLRCNNLAILIPTSITFLNGAFITHYSSGHTGWQGLLLAPWLILLLLNQNKKPESKQAFLFGLLIFYLLMLGSVHIAFWFFMVYIIQALVNRRYKLSSSTILCVTLLSSYRLIPAIYSFIGKDEYLPHAGYRTTDSLLSNMAVLKPHYWVDYRDAPIPLIELPNWESSMFVSAPFTILILSSILCYIIRKHGLIITYSLPIIIPLLASLSFIYVWIPMIDVPFSNFQRLPARFAIIPILLSSWLLLPLWALWYKKYRIPFILLSILGIHDLIMGLFWNNTSYLENIANIVALSTPNIADSNDLYLKIVVLLALLITATSILSLSWKILKEQKN